MAFSLLPRSHECLKWPRAETLISLYGDCGRGGRQGGQEDRRATDPWLAAVATGAAAAAAPIRLTECDVTARHCSAAAAAASERGGRWRR